jgi:hypothetical protein
MGFQAITRQVGIESCGISFRHTPHFVSNRRFWQERHPVRGFRCELMLPAFMCCGAGAKNIVLVQC